MNKLLVISIGPIQEFIASARRTRDLWYGSTLLSDISKAVAQSVQEQSGKLIFPESIEANSIANIILAEIPEDKNPKDIYEQAKKAGQSKWEQKASEVLNAVKNDVDEQLWKKQVEDAIEFYAASVPITTDYQSARNRLMKIFAGRKALRDFKQSEGNNNPKSSLDGRRESVLNKNHHIKGVIDKEQLCAIGLIKRKQGEQEKYPSVARITADYWIRQIKDTQEFKEFIEKCKEFNLNRIDENICKGKYYKDFPFDGSLLFEDRYTQLEKEENITKEQSDILKPLLKKITKKYGKIYPYFAIIQADGDQMGKSISSMKQADDHRTFSKKLATFSEGVKDIVETYNGVCVYSGGDDVFAFMPLDCALDCARKLKESFTEKVALPQATLSVGISVGHFMEPMEDLREYAVRAEKLAKNNDDTDETKRKNGLAVIINPRSGGNFHVREQWKDDLDKRIRDFAELFNNKELPAKLPYDLRTLATSLKYRNISDEEMIKNEIKVLLKRKQQNTERIKEVIEPRIKAIKTVKDLFEFAEEMLVAQWFAMAKQIKEVK